MQRLMFGILTLALLSPACTAQDAKPKPATPADEYQALVAEYRKLQEETRKTFQAAKADADKRKIFEEYEKKQHALAGRFLGLAQAHPKDAAAVDALLMVLNLGGDADQEKALNLLLTEHIQSEKIGQAGERLAQSGSPGAEKLLRTALDKNPHKAVQAQAAYNLGQLIKERIEEPGRKPEEAQKLIKEAEDLFDRVVKQAGDAKTGGGQPLAKQAEKELFEIRNLAIGKTAPDIEGADADGKKFKLSEYRGKVVVLDFWASWCGPCMAMVPHERELVKRLEGKPFALLGVNLDRTAAELKKTEAAHQMTWRSFFDGSEGPIAEKWNVQAIPAIYVLDHKGVIRYKGVRNKDMDKAVETLLKEVPASDKK